LTVPFISNNNLRARARTSKRILKKRLIMEWLLSSFEGLMDEIGEEAKDMLSPLKHLRDVCQDTLDIVEEKAKEAEEETQMQTSQERQERRKPKERSKRRHGEHETLPNSSRG